MLHLPSFLAFRKHLVGVLELCDSRAVGARGRCRGFGAHLDLLQRLQRHRRSTGPFVALTSAANANAGPASRPVVRSREAAPNHCRLSRHHPSHFRARDALHSSTLLLLLFHLFVILCSLIVQLFLRSMHTLICMIFLDSYGP